MKHCHLMGGAPGQSACPTHGKHRVRSLESPLPDITWGSPPLSKQKAGSGYSRYYPTIPGEHRTLVDVGSAVWSICSMIMTEGRLQSPWGRVSLLEHLLSFQHEGSGE